MSSGGGFGGGCDGGAGDSGVSHGGAMASTVSATAEAASADSGRCGDDGIGDAGGDDGGDGVSEVVVGVVPIHELSVLVPSQIACQRAASQGTRALFDAPLQLARSQSCKHTIQWFTCAARASAGP